MRIKQFFLFMFLVLLIGCGHTQTNKIGLMSMGDLEGKAIPENIEGMDVQGENCGGQYFLSEAVRDALNETQYDTIIDGEVTNETGLFIFNNCIRIKGKAIDSKLLTSSGGQ